MDEVARQYEIHPYPARDPAEERRRLIVGSPSDPREIDHLLFGGARDWSRPFRALVAGGGTGDGLIQLAQGLADAGCPAEIVYLDMSAAARKVAEARAAARGLTIDFRTGDLRTAPEIAAREGAFDYIDCCGVLHHLETPQEGFDALAAAVADGGGMGLMVYAPDGRAGVYPMQEALRVLLAEEPEAARAARARPVLDALPEGSLFRRNPFVTDHEVSDAGLHDLLLHARDRPFRAEELMAALDAAGLGLVSWLEPGRYDPLRLLPPGHEARVASLSPAARAGLAERLAGSMKMHVVYAAPSARAGVAAARMTGAAVPRLKGMAPAALAKAVAQRGHVDVTVEGGSFRLTLPTSAAPLIAALDGRRSLSEVARAAGLDWFAFAAAFGPVWRELTAFNLLHCSKGLPR